MTHDPLSCMCVLCVYVSSLLCVCLCVHRAAHAERPLSASWLHGAQSSEVTQTGADPGDRGCRDARGGNGFSAHMTERTVTTRTTRAATEPHERKPARACGLLCASHTVSSTVSGKGCLDTSYLWLDVQLQAARRFRPPPPPLVMKSRGTLTWCFWHPRRRARRRSPRFAPLGLSPEWEIVAQSSGLRHRLGTCSKGGGTTVFTKRENTRGCPQFAHTLCSTGRLHHPVAR